MTTEEKTPCVTVSISRKRNDSNYGHLEASAFLCNVPIGADKELIETMVQTADDCFDVLKSHVLDQVRSAAEKAA